MSKHDPSARSSTSTVHSNGRPKLEVPAIVLTPTGEKRIVYELVEERPARRSGNERYRELLILQAELERQASRADEYDKSKSRRFLMLAICGVLSLFAAVYGIYSSGLGPNGDISHLELWVVASSGASALGGALIAAVAAAQTSLSRRRQQIAAYQTSLRRAEESLDSVRLELEEKSHRIEQLRRQLRQQTKKSATKLGKASTDDGGFEHRQEPSEDAV
jgi:hypothetical protein